MNKKSDLSRRKFLTNVAAGGAAMTIVPRHVLGRGFTPPSDMLNIAGVGVGGMGRTNLINLSSQNIVALCDVDWGYADKGFDRLDTEIPNLQKRLDNPDPQPTPGQPPVEFDRAGLDVFDREASVVERMALIAHLRGDFGFLGALRQLPSFIDGPGERLLHVDVFTESHGGESDRRMHMVRSGDEDSVDILLVLEHVAIVLIALCHAANF